MFILHFFFYLFQLANPDPDSLAYIDGLLKKNDFLKKELEDYQGYLNGLVKNHEKELESLKRAVRDRNLEIQRLRDSAEIAERRLKSVIEETQKERDTWKACAIKKKSEVEKELIDWKVAYSKLDDRHRKLSGQKIGKRDQAVQALVETHCCAVEVQTSDTSFEKACQASCSNGDRPAC